jgi:hypothetical protein
MLPEDKRKAMGFSVTIGLEPAEEEEEELAQDMLEGRRPTKTRPIQRGAQALGEARRRPTKKR